MQQVSDEVLAERAKRGDRASFEELYRRYRSHLFAYILNMIRDYHLAEDLFQETFYKAFSRIDTFNGSNFQIWIFSIARHLIIDYWKKLKVRSKHPLIVIENDSIESVPWSDPQRKVVDAELLERVERSIQKLPEKLREPLIMYAILGMDYDEISSITGVNPRTLKVRVFRARVKLLKMMGDVL